MRIILLSFLCILVFGGGCKSNGTNLSRMDLDIFKDNQTGSIIFVGRPTKITDGDTIVLANAIKIRMHGIDAPESRQTCTDENGAEYACGKLATEHLKQIIGGGRVHCQMHKMDGYGRYLMTCHTPDGTDIHAQMVRDGYAVVSTYNPEIYADMETFARTNRRGLWRGKMRHPYCHRHQKKQDWIHKSLCDDNKYYTGWENQ